MRELEQAVRRIILSRQYHGDWAVQTSAAEGFQQRFQDTEMSARELLSNYCALLYKKHGTYEKVAEVTQLDRRTVKKHIDEHGN